MAVSNVTNVEFGNLTMVETEPHYQYDYGQKLKFTDLNLPSSYEVHFANDATAGIAYTQIGDTNGVEIPNGLFQIGKPIFAFIYLHKSSDDGKTVYVVKIPVRSRAKPTTYAVPTIEEQSVIAQAIATIQEIQGGATPQAANTISEMSDRKKIYVYTGSEDGYVFGNWYYYNKDNNKWMPGGQYASGIVIDDTLTKKGRAADAYETGLKINTLENNQIVFSDDGDGNIVLTKHSNT